MSLGIHSLTLVVFSTLVTFLNLTLVAAFFERSLWPNKISPKLEIRLVVIVFSGVTLFQTLMLKGINLPSLAIATAMLNLAPGLIFFIAWTIRLEKVDLGCLYCKVTIVSTSTRQVKVMTSMIFNRDKITGCFYLMAAIFCLSTNVVLQVLILD